MMSPLSPNPTLVTVRRWIQPGLVLWYGLAGWIGLLWIGLLSGNCFAQPPAPISPSNAVIPSSSPDPQVDRQVLVDLVSKLAADNFKTREIAKAKLLEMGSGIIALLDENLAEADVDASTQIFEIYSQFALDPQSEATSQVVKSLKKLIAAETSRNSILAAQLLESIRELHGERASMELDALGAGVILGIYPLNGRTGIEQQYFVEVNEGFRGTAKDLVWLQWLTKVDLVVLKGPNVNGEYLKYLSEMPSLSKLLIRDTSIVSADLQLLNEIDSLDHLEILYSPIDDKSVETLAGLSVWKSMRIFGTNISYEAGEGLVKRLDGIEVQFGCGGFLGIQSDVQAARTSTVSETTPNGAAERAGIVSGDIITKIEDEPITTFEDIRASLRKRRPSEKIMVELERATFDGEMRVLQVSVILGRQE
jgi:hypothetical protein